MSDEFAWEADEREGDELELESADEFEMYEHDGESSLNEMDELELAAELLEVSDEMELDQFLGNLIKRAGRAVGGFVRSPVGQALGGVLKGAARKALPIVGGAIGSAIDGDAGGRVGGQLASKAGQLFGLELEGLSGEDQEFEVARRFVRFASAAARRAVRTRRHGRPRRVARASAIAAARRFAPGLLRGRGGVRRRRRGWRIGGGGAWVTPGIDGVQADDADDGSGMASDDSQDSADANDAADTGMQGDPPEGADSSEFETGGSGAGGRTGRWRRRGRHIIVLNC